MRDPFVLDCRKADRTTEFGFGAGQSPDPRIDFSQGGVVSGFPIADPDRRAQFRELVAIKRMDLQDPTAQPDPYVTGNTERYGAQPPIIRERKAPKTPRIKLPLPKRMERKW